MQVVIVSLALFYSSTVLLFMQRGNNVLHLSIETGRLDVVQYLAIKMGVHLYDIKDEGVQLYTRQLSKEIFSLWNILWHSGDLM